VRSEVSAAYRRDERHDIRCGTLSINLFSFEFFPRSVAPLNEFARILALAASGIHYERIGMCGRRLRRVRART